MKQRIKFNSIINIFSDKKELLDGMKKYCDGVDGVMKYDLYIFYHINILENLMNFKKKMKKIKIYLKVL